MELMQTQSIDQSPLLRLRGHLEHRSETDDKQVWSYERWGHLEHIRENDDKHMNMMERRALDNSWANIAMGELSFGTNNHDANYHTCFYVFIIEAYNALFIIDTYNAQFEQYDSFELCMHWLARHP